MTARRLNLPLSPLEAAAALGVALVGGLLVGSGLVATDVAGILILLGVAAGLTVIAWTRHGTLLHPSLVLGGIFIVMGLLGFLLYPLVEADGPTPLFGSAVGPQTATLRVLLLFGIAPIAIAAFAPRADVAARRLRIDVGQQSRRVRRTLLGFVLAVAVVFIFGSNIPTLIHRAEYHGFAEGSFVELFRLGNGLHVPAALTAAIIVYSRGTSTGERVAAWSALVVFFGMDLATSSRTLGLLPLLMLLAYVLTRGRLPKLRWVVAGGVAALACISLAIYLRGTEDHGLAPYARTITSHPQEAFVSEVPAVTANLLSGFPLAAYVNTYGTEVDVGGLWSTLNPLPSSQVASLQTIDYKVADYMPYSAVGTLARVGTWIGVAYFAIIGLLFAVLWKVGHRDSARATIARPILLGAAVIIAAISLQYALRTTTRLATLVLVGVPVLLVLTPRPREAEGAGDPGPAANGAVGASANRAGGAPAGAPAVRAPGVHPA